MQRNMNHLKSLSLNVDVAILNRKDAKERFSKFEKTPAKIGEEVAWNQRQSELKEKQTQVIVEIL